MKLLFLIEKLKVSDVFQQYKEKNPSSYFFAGFFVLDLKTKENQYNLDYCNEKGDIMTFSLNGEIKAKKAEPINNRIPKAIKDALKIDIDSMEDIAIKEAGKKEMTLDKIIAILQNFEGKVIWSLTCMQGMKIIKIKVDSETGEILKSDSLNLFDIAKRINK